MAIYKGREVTINSVVTDENPLVEVMHKDGDREQVRAAEIKMTASEKKEFDKQGRNEFAVISDEEVQKIRDSQDKAKIEKEQAKNPEQTDVVVNKIKVPMDAVNAAKAK